MASLQSYILRFLIRHTINWNKTLAEVRQDLVRLDRTLKLPDGVDHIPVSAGNALTEWFLPAKASEESVIVYLHGGGYGLGLVNTNRSFVARIAKTSGLRVLLVDYGLAPEHPFPAALDDTLTAYRWLLSQGVRPEKIGFLADSSGGGLGLATLISLRDAGDPLPVAMACMAPMVDLTHSGESRRTRANIDPYRIKPEFYIDRHYVKGHDPMNPLISPLYADLRHLPPMLIHASDYDIFLSDAIRLAEKAQHAGIEVSLKIWEKMWHLFHMSAAILPEGRIAVQEICTYLRNKVESGISYEEYEITE